MTVSTADLRTAWLGQKAANPRAHARDVAQALAVSECTLVASFDGATRLAPEWDAIVQALPSLGHVKTMTRNDDAVIEKHGAYEDVQFFGKTGQVVGRDIDLRVFLFAWAHGYALTEPGPNGPRRSLQFFDHDGNSIHKVYEEAESVVGAYDAIVARFSAADQTVPMLVPHTAEAKETPDSEIDVDGLRGAWDNLRDTHDFFGLLREFGVTRTQALRLAGPGRAQPMPAAVAAQVLENAAETQRKIMIFVGNKGIIQIFIGMVARVVRMSGWLNVLDPDFNLHLRDDNIATAWWVRKPTSDGMVNSIELFNARGENIALLFSKRNPGEVESPEWPAFLSTLEALHA
jgi:putative hemin transport protein